MGGGGGGGGGASMIFGIIIHTMIYFSEKKTRSHGYVMTFQIILCDVLTYTCVISDKQLMSWSQIDCVIKSATGNGDWQAYSVVW